MTLRHEQGARVNTLGGDAMARAAGRLDETLGAVSCPARGWACDAVSSVFSPDPHRHHAMRPISLLCCRPGRPVSGCPRSSAEPVASRRASNGARRQRLRAEDLAVSDLALSELSRWLWAAATTFGVIFLAELGDKSQLVCMTLAARHRRWPVLIGAVAAFVVLNSLAVVFGVGLSQWIPERDPRGRRRHPVRRLRGARVARRRDRRGRAGRAGATTASSWRPSR
jgi:hypothetical protein